MNRIQADVPLEAVLKYIKKDRDRYKARLEKIVPYTKALEAEKAKLEEALAKRDEQIRKLNREITRSSLYQALQERYNKLKSDNRELQLQIGKFYREGDDKNAVL